MYKSVAKPVHRGPIRMWLGRRYFILKRYWKWYFGKQRFATARSADPLPCEIFAHQTPMLRRLKDLEMHLQYNKVTNLKIATQKLSGILIRPGETFSFWYLVGRTSRSKGYKEGMLLRNGKIVSGVGGGLCQLSNLIFWMAIHSPLSIVERWRHSYDVFPDVKRTQPFGSGATLSYNYVDLQIKNETKTDFQFQFWLADDYLHGAIRSSASSPYKFVIEEQNHQIVGESWGGYTRHNQIIKKIYDKESEVLVREELIAENHAIMLYQPFLSASGQWKSEQPSDSNS